MNVSRYTCTLSALIPWFFKYTKPIVVKAVYSLSAREAKSSVVTSLSLTSMLYGAKSMIGKVEAEFESIILLRDFLQLNKYIPNKITVNILFNSWFYFGNVSDAKRVCDFVRTELDRNVCWWPAANHYNTCQARALHKPSMPPVSPPNASTLSRLGQHQ